MNEFERYDDEFSSLIEQIESSLDEEPPNQYTHNLLQQCDDLIKQMALEARSVSDASLKRDLLAKVRTCKSKYQTLQQQSERQGLLGNTDSSSPSGGGGEKERYQLQKSEDMLLNQNETLERAHRSMQETEAVALEITEELGQNREKLVSTHGRVREMSGLTGRARNILYSMNRRAVQQKILMYGVAVGLVLVFFILLYAMWR